MVYRRRLRRGKKSGKGRKIFKKRGMVKKTVLVNHALQPIAQRYITKMKYSETVTTAGLSGLYQFNLNSTFDPNFTGIGHQPLGRDTLATLYNRYRVISVGWRIISGANSTVSEQFAVVPTSGAPVAVGDINAVKEQPRCKYAFCAASESKVISGYVHLPSLAGVSRTTYMGSDRYQALNTANPTEAMYLNIYSADGAGAFNNWPIQVQLEYLVEWFDPIELSQS